MTLKTSVHKEKRERGWRNGSAVRSPGALAETPSSVASTLAGWLTTTCDISSQRPDAHIHTHAHTQTDTCKKKIFFKAPNKIAKKETEKDSTVF